MDFNISKALVPDAWIPHREDYICVEFKYERLPKFLEKEKLVEL